MSGPFFSGYDAWKTREPEEHYECCVKCGHPLEIARIDGRPYVRCERCDDGMDYGDEEEVA